VTDELSAALILGPDQPQRFLTAWHGPQYRRRDSLLMALFPFMNFVLAAKVGWRLANLPSRDWRPRPDEPGFVEWQPAHEMVR
jgi:hypothetical protein